MTILVDADACPVKGIIESLGKKYGLKVLFISNTSHQLSSDYAEMITVDKISQSVDVAIINSCKEGDIIVTQDYGLASIVLLRGCAVIHPSGKEYLDSNIEQLLLQRYVNQKIIKGGGRIKGPKKRLPLDNEHFYESLERIILQTKQTVQ